MRIQIRRSIVVPFALIFSWGTAAQEISSNISPEEQLKLGCVCVLPSQTSPVALLDEIKGEVLKLSSAGYSRLTSQELLDLGDSVLLKRDGTAVLKAGLDCTRAVGPQASLVIRDLGDGRACAALLEEKPTQAAAFGPAILAVGVAALGVGGLLLLAHHAPPASP